MQCQQDWLGPWSLGGTVLSLSSPLLVLPAILGSLAVEASLCLCCHSAPSLCVCISVLMRTPVIRLRVTLISMTSSVKAPFPNTILFTGNGSGVDIFWGPPFNP